jgi:prephenate dehydrogenase
VRGAHAVALCVPAKALSGLLDDLASALDPGQILFDITSVKMLPMEAMEAAHRGPVVGTHPLFGPNPAPEDLAVAVTPGRRAGEAHIRLVEDLYAGFGCRVFRTTAEEHDRGVAFVQGLNFISSAAYLASLARRDDVLPFLTPSFRRRLEGARKLLTEDGDMFQGVTAANPMTGDAIHTFRLFLDLVEGGGLSDVLRRARWWYATERPDAPEAGRGDAKTG